MKALDPLFNYVGKGWLRLTNSIRIMYLTLKLYIYVRYALYRSRRIKSKKKRETSRNVAYGMQQYIVKRWIRFNLNRPMYESLRYPDKNYADALISDGYLRVGKDGKLESTPEGIKTLEKFRNSLWI